MQALPAPAGEMAVVLGPDGRASCCTKRWATGWRRTSTAEGVGLQRPDRPAGGESLCTVIDDGTIRNRRGSLNRGTTKAPPPRKTCSSKRVCCADICSTSSLAGCCGLRHGQRAAESYQHIPMPRMTNTFMLAGDSDPEDIIRSTSRGLYCANFARPGGHHQRQFRVQWSESYLIEDGHITRPVRGAMLTGNGPEALKQRQHGGARLEAR